jgi:hypothetical protein
MKKTALVLTLILVAVFFAGLSATSFTFVGVVKANPHNMPPEWIVLSPKNNTVYNTDNFNLSFMVKSIINYDYYYTIDTPIAETPTDGPAGQGKTLINVTLISETPGEGVSKLKTFQYKTELHGLSDGQHNLTLYHGYNVFTGWRYEPASATIIFYIDSSAPKISDLSVVNTDSGRLVSFTVDTETSWVGYSLDNQANVTVNSDIFLKGLAVGSHNVTVYAEDAAGNMGASETIYFTIEDPFPTSLVMASSVIATAVCIGLGLLVYLIKRK